MTTELIANIIKEAVSNTKKDALNKGISEVYCQNYGGNCISLGLSYECHPDKWDEELRIPHYYLNIFWDDEYVDISGHLSANLAELEQISGKIAKKWNEIQDEIENAYEKYLK